MSSMFTSTQLFDNAQSQQQSSEEMMINQFEPQQAMNIQNSQNYETKQIISNNPQFNNSQENNQQFVMIDQQQLLELMQAKQILDAQRQASAQPKVTCPRINSCHQEFFSTPQTPPKHGNQYNASQNTFNHLGSKDTQDESSHENVEQEQSLFKSPFMFDLEDEFNLDDQDKSMGLDNCAQSNNIKNSLLNMIDDEPSESCEFNPNGNQQDQCQKEVIDNLVQAIQSIDLQGQSNLCSPHEQAKNTGNSYDEQNQSIFKGSALSTLNMTSEGSQFTGNSIFSSSHSSEEFHRGTTAPSTINNIVINNFNTQPSPQFINEAIHQQNVQPLQFFPPLDTVVKQAPTIEQAAELAQVTQMAGGVKPLHKSSKPERSSKAQPFVPPVEPQNSPLMNDEKKEKKCEKSKSSFDFPEGGWECSKCQNYNFKGRKECFRCKKLKSEEDHDGKPTHMFLPANEKAALKAAKSKKHHRKGKKEQSEQKGCKFDQSENGQTQSTDLNKINSFATYPVNNQNAPVDTKAKNLQQRQIQGQNANKKHQNQERVGDWTCQRCFNHNYAFRDVCNMCYLSHIESNKMLYNQQSNRLESVQGGICSTPQQPQVYYQAPVQFQAETQQQFNVMDQQKPKLSLLSQSAKPFIPTYLKNKIGNNSPLQQDIQQQMDN